MTDVPNIIEGLQIDVSGEELWCHFMDRVVTYKEKVMAWRSLGTGTFRSQIGCAEALMAQAQLKQALGDPWADVAQRFPAGSVVVGVPARLIRNSSS